MLFRSSPRAASLRTVGAPCGAGPAPGRAFAGSPCGPRHRPSPGAGPLHPSQDTAPPAPAERLLSPENTTEGRASRSGSGSRGSGCRLLSPGGTRLCGVSPGAEQRPCKRRGTCGAGRVKGGPDVFLLPALPRQEGSDPFLLSEQHNCGASTPSSPHTPQLDKPMRKPAAPFFTSGRRFPPRKPLPRGPQGDSPGQTPVST